MRRKQLFLSLIWLIIALLSALLLSDSSKVTHVVLALLTTFSYFLCAYSWIKAGCRFVSIYMFFLAYAYLCNCGQSLLYIFGVPFEFLSSYWNLSIEGVSYALRFQLVCIAALNVGTCLALMNKDNCVSINQLKFWYRNLSNATANAADTRLFPIMMLLLAGTLYTTIEIAQLRSTMSYRDWMYEGVYAADSRFYFSYFYAFLSLRSVLRKQHILLVYLSWLFFIVLFMSLGLRTQTIPYISFFIVTLPITHSRLFQKKFYPVWIVSGFMFVILLGIISSTRVNESVDLSEANREAGLAVSFYTAMADVGGPAETTGLTMELVDNGLPHYQSILYSIITVIPKRVFKLPSRLFEVQGWEAMSSPGSFMSKKAGLPGFGFSFIAEAYLNYGWFGWIFVLLYGFIIAGAENMAYRDIMNNSFFKITFLLWLAKQVFYARADLCLGENYIEYMIFTAIIYKLLKPKEKLFILN